MQIITDEQAAAFSAFLAAHDFFYVIGHKEPDGDCVYSCLSMGALLDAKKQPYQLLNAGSFKRAEIKDKADLFTNVPTFLSEPERKKTGIIMLDCSETARLGDIDGDLGGLDTFTIDHHKTASVTENCIIDATSPATAVLVQQLYEKLFGQPPKDVAEMLFFGLATDTGYFRFLKEDAAEVFMAAARLVAAGANPRQVYERMTGGKAYTTRKLLGVMLGRAERYYNNKLVITYETMEDTHKYGQEGRDNDALYSLLLACDGVEAVVFLRQETEHTCTAGFRSRDAVDVSAIAAQFGGGGHKNAAGLSIEGTLETIIPEIKKAFAKVL